MAFAPTHVATHTHEFDLDAGIVALDFANTLDGRYDPQPKDHLRDYRDLLVFSLLAGTLDQPLADRLAAAAVQSPDPSEQQLRHAKKLREAIFGNIAGSALISCSPVSKMCEKSHAGAAPLAGGTAKLAARPACPPTRPPERLRKPSTLLLKKSLQTMRVEVRPPCECPASQRP